MCRARRVGDQAAHVPQTDRAGAKLHVVEQAGAGVQTFLQLEDHHAATTPHLPLR